MMHRLGLLVAVLMLVSCGQGKDTVISSSNPKTVTPSAPISTYTGRIKNVQDYNAIGDGVADDTKAIQAAMDDGDGVVVLMSKHKISGTLVNRNSNTITYRGNGKAQLSGVSNDFYKFESLSNLTISKVSSNPPFLKLSTATPYEKLAIDQCDLITNLQATKSVNNYAMLAKGQIHIDTIIVSNSSIKNATVFYAEKTVTANNTYILNNSITNFRSFVIAMQSCNNTYLENNRISGAMDDTQSVRVMLRTGLLTTTFRNNTVQDINNALNTSIIYASSGSLVCEGNTFRNISGVGNSYLIADKSKEVSRWQINNNVFDQTEVVTQGLNGMIYSSNNETIIKKNIFKNLKKKAIQVGSPYGAPGLMKKTTISKNEFIDIMAPMCINLVFTTGEVVIHKNIVKGLSNPSSVQAHNDATCRFISIINTKQSYSLAPILISSNNFSGLEERSSILWVNSKNGGGISKVSLQNNILDSGGYLVSYRNKETRPTIELSENTVPSFVKIGNTKNKNLRFLKQ